MTINYLTISWRTKIVNIVICLEDYNSSNIETKGIITDQFFYPLSKSKTNGFNE